MTTMTLSDDEIARVAQLARLPLDHTELHALHAQLSAILAHFTLLNDVDVTGIPPTAHVNDVVNALRDDVVAPSLPRESVLLNAPAHHDGMFRVGSVFEE